MIDFDLHQVVLVQTKSYTIDETSAERLFGNNRSYNSLVTKGPVIGLEFAGTNCVEICRQALTELLAAKYPTLPRRRIPALILHPSFFFLLKISSAKHRRMLVVNWINSTILPACRCLLEISFVIL